MKAASSARRVALVNPPGLKAARALNMNTPCPPLGLAYVAAALREAGHDVTVIDGTGAALDHVRRHPGRDDLWMQGLSPDEIAARVPVDAGVIGITCMFSALWPITRRVIAAVRRRVPDALVVLGGEHGTALPEYTLHDSGPDVVVLGEGEETIVRLVGAWQRKEPLDSVPGVAFLDEGRLVTTGLSPRVRAIDAIPEPAWDLFPVEEYIGRHQSNGINLGRSMPLLATRGCPYACTFCSNPGMWTRRYIARSPAAVADEMERNFHRHGAQNFDFQDLTAIVKRSWVVEFCQELISRRLPVTWQMPSGTRSEVFDDEVVDLLARAGCRVLSFAPESGDRDVLRDVKKQVDLDALVEAARRVVRRGLKLSCFFVIGFPSDSEASLERTARFARRLAVLGVHDVAVAKFTPYPGSELFGKLLASGEVELDDAFFLSAMDIHSKAGVSWCRNVSAARLDYHQWRLLLSFYTLSALLHPRRTFRAVARAAAFGEEETRYAKWLVDKLSTRRRWMRRLDAGPVEARHS